MLTQRCARGGARAEALVGGAHAEAHVGGFTSYMVATEHAKSWKTRKKLKSLNVVEGTFMLNKETGNIH